jgi:SpoVK/Ycf46/Vps4 family AAA+-type ATPase
VDYLLGSDRLDARLVPFCELRAAPADAPSRASEPALPSDTERNLARLLQAGRDATGGSAGHNGPAATAAGATLLYLHGPPGTARRAMAEAACALAGRRLLLVDLAALLAAEKPAPERLLALAAREARMQEAVLGLDGFDPLLADRPELLPVRAQVRRLLEQRAAPTVLIGEARWEPATWFQNASAIRVELPSLSPLARQGLWRQELDGRIAPEHVTDLAGRFRLDGDGIRAVAAAARGRAAWRGDGQAIPEDFRAAAQAIAAPPLEGLTQRVEPRYGWDDIVLPPASLRQLRELCARARFQGLVREQWGFGKKHARRAGLSALFAGPPGTGKTMAAEVVAGDLGLDLHRIELSGVVSKYIGETEKNLERIFRAADQGDAVLLFDEADALFGKRSAVSDAHDRYANVEIAYLLQRLEAYDGVAILTTNLRGNIDEAFVRRFGCILEFPLPEEAERLAIWQHMVPPECPLAPDVDLAFLARKFKLAGGHIRNITLAAAYLAAAEGGPVAMKHLVRAVRREHQKIGRLVAESEFERYHALLQDP